MAAQERLHRRPDHAVLRRAGSARHGRGGRDGARRLLRVPVVERAARQDLHGRHRVARARRRARRAGRVHEDPAAACDPGRALRDHHALRDHSGRLVQDHRAPGVQDGAAAASFRAARLGRDHDRGEVLADRRPVHRARPRHLLRGLAADLLTLTMDITPLPQADLDGVLAGRRVCVNGLGISGPPVARALAARGACVTAVDGRDDQDNRRVADELAGLGIAVVLGADPQLPAGTDLVVTTPGWRPGTPMLAAAAAAGIPVIGDVELAWRLRPVLPGGARQDWLAVTGTNGKTTTVRMLAAMLAAAGHRSIAAGNVGTPILDVVTDPEPYPVVAVELSSFQLFWSTTIAPLAAVVLNVAAHHLDWHDDIQAYVA